MSRDNDLPFARGTTYGASSSTDGAQFEGREYVVDDISPITGVRRSFRKVKLRVVRNSSGVALPPKRLVAFADTGFTSNSGAGAHGKIECIARTTAVRCYPVDEYLPAAGCPSDDLCYIVVEGPATCLSTLTQSSGDIAVGALVVAFTATTSAGTNGVTDGGRIDIQGLLTSNSTGAALQNQIRNAIGFAVTACTSQGYGQDVVVDVGKI